MPSAGVGWDTNRLAMVLAVLEAHCGVRLGAHDVYLNIAGGYRISEPAADLAVAAALVSSMTGLALPAAHVYFGEVSLSGSVRPVSHAPLRLKEAQKLGFSAAVLPKNVMGGTKGEAIKNENKQMKSVNFVLNPVGSLADLVARIAAQKI